MGHEVLGNQASHVPNEEHTRTELDIQSARDEIPSALDESPGAVVQRLLTVSLGFALFLVGLVRPSVLSTLALAFPAPTSVAMI